MELEDAGAEVWTLRADVGELEDMAEVVQQIHDRYGRLDCVFHTAGVVHDGLLAKKRMASVDDVLRAKVQGAWVLDQVTQGDPPSLMVLFSSISAVLGSPGQADYAAANAYLDCFASWRSSVGRPTMSINWGLWGEVGMGVKRVRQIERSGTLRAMPTDAAIAALQRALSFNTSRLIVAALGEQLQPPIHRPGVVANGHEAVEAGVRDIASFTLEQVEQHLRELLGRLLEVEQSELSKDRHFAELGLDSILVVQLTRELETRIGRQFKFDLLQDYPTLGALANYLHHELTAD